MIEIWQWTLYFLLCILYYKIIWIIYLKKAIRKYFGPYTFEYTYVMSGTMMIRASHEMSCDGPLTNCAVSYNCNLELKCWYYTRTTPYTSEYWYTTPTLLASSYSFLLLQNIGDNNCCYPWCQDIDTIAHVRVECNCMTEGRRLQWCSNSH